MTQPHWTALIAGLALLSLLAWLLLLALWLIGKFAARLAIRSWDIRPYLFRWLTVSLAITTCASFAGLWLTDVATPLRGAERPAIHAYSVDVVKQSITILAYVLALAAIHVVWIYLSVLVGFLTGKYPRATRSTQP